jgi:hypothetical protein
LVLYCNVFSLEYEQLRNQHKLTCFSHAQNSTCLQLFPLKGEENGIELRRELLILVDLKSPCALLFSLEIFYCPAGPANG